MQEISFLVTAFYDDGETVANHCSTAIEAFEMVLKFSDCGNCKCTVALLKGKKGVTQIEKINN